MQAADQTMLVQSAELERLRRKIDTLEDALVAMRDARDEQFKRAERMLRARMHPEDLAVDTLAGNDPDRSQP